MAELGRWEVYLAASTDDQNKHQEIFEKIWCTYYPRIFKFVQGFSFGPDSEDITQEIFLKAIDKLQNYKPTASFKSWLYRLARNHCIDHFRASRNKTVNSQMVEDTFERSVNQLQELQYKDELGYVLHFIESLDARDRQISQLRFFEELNARQIGYILDMPGGTVRYRVSEIRKLFKRYWRKLNETRQID